jgi:hypothetical protein
MKKPATRETQRPNPANIRNHKSGATLYHHGNLMSTLCYVGGRLLGHVGTVDLAIYLFQYLADLPIK